jgi:16S rRNA (cytidine1402-2'-O)-methyltransferase
LIVKHPRHARPPPAAPRPDDRIGETHEAIAAAVCAQIGGLLDRPLAPGLHVVATPIGNLADITLRAIATLAACDIIYCEDTRHSRALLDRYAIKATLRAYHEHNAEGARPQIIAELAAGMRIGLISDAGTPTISDPGYKLVRGALYAGHMVHAVPGPSALVAALSTAGLATDTFLFAGFLPVRTGPRRGRLAALQAVPATLIFYEAPGRLSETLRDIAAVLGEREAAVARELTKVHEEARRGTPTALAQHFEQTPPKGEIVILIAPPGVETITDEAIRDQLRDALAGSSVRDAVDLVTKVCEVPRKRVYDLALAMRREER